MVNGGEGGVGVMAYFPSPCSRCPSNAEISSMFLLIFFPRVVFNYIFNFLLNFYLTFCLKIVISIITPCPFSLGITINLRNINERVKE